MWDKALKVLATVAPTLAAAIGGPLAGQAVQFLGNALGLPAETAEDQIAKAVVAATPDQLLALKNADQDFAVRMRELDIDILRIDANDRDSARRRQVDMRDWTPAILAVIILACWGLMQWHLVTVTVAPVIGEVVLARILGMMDAGALAVIYYFFGSSSSSAKKDDAITKR